MAYEAAPPGYDDANDRRQVFAWMAADLDEKRYVVDPDDDLPTVWDAKALARSMQREADRQAIADALNEVFEGFGSTAVAGVSDDDLMIVGDGCDMTVLKELRKTLRTMEIDVSVFATMQCNRGPLLKVR